MQADHVTSDTHNQCLIADFPGGIVAIPYSLVHPQYGLYNPPSLKGQCANTTDGVLDRLNSYLMCH